MISNLNNVAIALNMSFLNTKYNNYNKSSFVIEMEFLVDGMWQTRLFDSKMSDQIQISDYFKTSVPIRAMRISRVFYNNQELPEADWGVEDLVLECRRSYTVAPTRTYTKQDEELYESVEALEYRKHTEVWSKDLPFPEEFENDVVDEYYFVFMFCLELRLQNKTLVLNSPDVTAEGISARVEKVSRFNGQFVTKNFELVSDISVDRIDEYRLEDIGEVRSYPSSNEDVWHLNYQMKDNNSIEDVYVFTILGDERYDLSEIKPIILDQRQHKAEIDIKAAFKNFNIYVYDGRAHSLINPMTNKFFEMSEIRELIKEGCLRYPVNPDLEVYTEEDKLDMTITEFKEKLDPSLAHDTKFIKINDRWLRSSLFESVEVKGGDSYRIQSVVFDNEGIAYIPIVPKDWLLVKKVTLVNQDDLIINSGNLAVYNQNGSPIMSLDLAENPSVSFEITRDTGQRYLFRVNGNGFYYNPQQPKETPVTFTDIVTSNVLIEKGYDKLFLPSKRQRVCVNSYVEPDEYEQGPPVLDEVNIEGWWGNVVNRCVRVPSSWFSTNYPWSIAQINNVVRVEKNNMPLENNYYNFVTPSLFETDLTKTPDSFRILVKLGEIKHETTAKSFTVTKYLDDELNITENMIKRMVNNPESDTKIDSMTVFLDESNTQISSALTVSMGGSFKRSMTMLDFTSPTRRLYDMFATFENRNVTSKRIEPIILNLRSEVPVNNPMFFMFDVSSGPLEVDIAKRLKGNPEDIQLADYDFIRIRQETLTPFIMLRDLDDGNNLKAQVIRPMTFKGETYLELPKVPVKDIPTTHKFLRDDIRKRISKNEGIPKLGDYYDDQISLDVYSKNTPIKHFSESNFVPKGTVKSFNYITDVDFLVDRDEVIIDNPIYKITNVLFRNFGTQRLSKNYLRPNLWANKDGSSPITGYTPESMLFDTKVRVKDDVRKNEGDKLIYPFLSTSNTVYSKLLKRPYTGPELYNWSVSMARNEYRDKEFLAFVRNDSLYASTEIEVFYYISMFFIPVKTEYMRKEGLLLGKEYLKGYKPRDIYGNVYPHDDIENIEYTLNNEIEEIDFGWANSSNKHRVGIDDIIYSYKNPEYVPYEIKRKVAGYMNKDSSYKIVDLDEEKFRPLNNRNERYDCLKNLSEVNFKLINTDYDFLPVWSDTKDDTDRKGISSIIIKKRGV